MSQEELVTGLKDIIKDLQNLDQNMTAQSNIASGSRKEYKELIQKIIKRVKELLDVANDPSSTQNQAQKTGPPAKHSLSPSSSSPKTVQVYLAVDTPEGVDTALMKFCKDMSYKCVISKRTNTLKIDLPLIVVCPVISRLEPDIDHALNGLEWESLFIVLVLHQGNEHFLPVLYTEKRLPEKPMYENAKFVDMAYSLEFYACKMNEDAKQKIKEFVDSYKNRYQSAKF